MGTPPHPPTRAPRCPVPSPPRGRYLGVHHARLMEKLPQGDTGGQQRAGGGAELGGGGTERAGVGGHPDAPHKLDNPPPPGGQTWRGGCPACSHRFGGPSPTKALGPVWGPLGPGVGFGVLPTRPPPVTPFCCVCRVLSPPPQKKTRPARLYLSTRPTCGRSGCSRGAPGPDSAPPQGHPGAWGRRAFVGGGGVCVCPPPASPGKPNAAGLCAGSGRSTRRGCWGPPVAPAPPMRLQGGLGGAWWGGCTVRTPTPSWGGGVGSSPTSPQVFGLDSTAQLPAGCHCGDKGGVGGPLS